MFTRFKGHRRVSNALTTSSTSSSMNSPSEITTISTYRDSHDELPQAHLAPKVDVIDDLYDFFTDDTAMADDDILAFETTEKQHRKRQALIQQLFDFESDYVNRLHVILLYFKRPISLHYQPSSSSSSSTRSSSYDSNAGIQIHHLQQQQQQQQQRNHHSSNISSALLSPFLSKQPSSSLPKNPTPSASNSSSFYTPSFSSSHVNINMHDIDVLFASIEPLYKLHEEFLEKLSERFRIWSSLQLVSDILQPLLSSILPVYNPYFENYPKIMAILEIIGKSRDGTKLTETVVTNPGGIGRVHLLSLLELPLYAIARYHQLITEITKLTDFNHPDLRHLKICQHKVQKMDLDVNPRVNICQNISRLMDMSLTVIGSPLMMDQPRQLIKSGKLCYVEGKSTHDLRICFLTSDQLITARPSSTAGSNKLHFKGKVSLKGATIKTVNRIDASFVITENATTDTSHQHADDIELLLNASGTSPSRQHHFKMEKEDLHSWVREIQNVVQSLRQRK
ncbi:Dbl homology domain-containing protein [Absidia repens]|uniref:Dbl homology domain-containing protein n=1 Tax=Absidia repens TaxID=90262 RepID=A0A1X2IY18_9FUNG|nr:Dbl homology domain-containing protein [Absidia repens]